MPTFEVQVSVSYRVEASTDVEALKLIGAARAADEGFTGIGYSGVYEVAEAPQPGDNGEGV